MALLPLRGRAPRVLAIVLAGGEGKRLMPLTLDRAKPAVPVGGRYRLIDFVLSNFVNSGILKIKVVTQYKSDSLNAHVARGWRLPQMLDFYVECVPAQMRLGPQWFRGSADALFQSLNVVTDEQPEYVCVFSSDHIYKMEVGQMLEEHIQSGAHVSVAAIPVPCEEAHSFGVVGVDSSGMMTSFTEKPPDPTEMPDRPGWSLASMGNYIWNTDALIAELNRDQAATDASQHDFGRNILPALVGRRPVYVHDFARNMIPGQGERERGYWKDVGTLAAYYDANMDLCDVHPVFDMYNPRWPLRTYSRPYPPAKFVFADEITRRVGAATDSLVCEGCIISGGRVNRTILSPNVRVNSFAYVEESIVFEGCNIGRRAKIRRAVIDKNVHVPEGMSIGYDHEEDTRLGLTVLPREDLVVVPKGHRFPQ